MNKLLIVFCNCIIVLGSINLANSQNHEVQKYKIAKSYLLLVLPHTHYDIKLGKSFLVNWKLIQPDDSAPKAHTFESISKTKQKTILRIRDYIESEQEIVKAIIKNSLLNTEFTLNNEHQFQLNNQNIDFLFYQDQQRNVRAYFTFKVKKAVVSTEILTKYENYDEVYENWYEILKVIKPVDKEQKNYDKILLSPYSTINIPYNFTYTLPLPNKLFVSHNDETKLQAFASETKKEVNKIANDIELRLFDELNFERFKGNIHKKDGNEIVELQGKIDPGTLIHLFVIKKYDTNVVLIFEYSQENDVNETIQNIVESVQFRTYDINPTSILPYAQIYDTNQDSKPEYFNINMIFFNKSKEVVADKIKHSEITVKIIDDNGKTVFLSEKCTINSPYDCLTGGNCSEKLRFEGVWLEKLKNDKFKISITFNGRQIYKGSFTDLIIR